MIINKLKKCSKSYNRYFFIFILILLIRGLSPWDMAGFMRSAVYGEEPATEDPTPFTPDGIILHSGRCTGPEGKYSDFFSSKNFHYIIKKDGKTLKIAPDKAVPHVGSEFNHRSLSILIEGNFGMGDIFQDILQGKKVQTSLPPAQWNGLKRLLFKLTDKYQIPLSQIERHMDHDTWVHCPGYNFPYLELLYSMSKDILRSAKKPLLEDICKNKNIPIPIQNASLSVDKSEKKLSIYSGKILLKVYNIGLSRIPRGDKEKEGDLKTPVGTFYICEKYPQRAWMRLSYPDKKHAEKGLKNKTITQEEYDKIIASIEKGGIPCQDTPLGCDVGIHAGGFPYSKMKSDSTAGCVSLEDAEAFELYYCIPLKTPVTINE